jgi:hypothetical protein
MAQAVQATAACHTFVRRFEQGEVLSQQLLAEAQRIYAVWRSGAARAYKCRAGSGVVVLDVTDSGLAAAAGKGKEYC